MVEQDEAPYGTDSAKLRTTHDGLLIMTKSEDPIKHILASLQERAKELNCLYAVDEILSRWDASMEEVAHKIIEVMPPGWQYPHICQARMVVHGVVYQPGGFVETEWRQAADIVVEGQAVGDVLVFYTEERPQADEGPFLKEERRLINAIAERISFFLLQRRLRSTHRSWEDVERISSQEHPDWKVILNFIGKTDQKLLARITRKMINRLCEIGTEEGEKLLQEFLTETPIPEQFDENRPQRRRELAGLMKVMGKTFDLAARYCSEDELLLYLQSWIEEEKAAGLVNTLENPHSGLMEMTEAVLRFQNADVDESKLSISVRKSLRVALLRRLFSDQSEFVNVAKHYFNVVDFYDLFQRVVHSSQSHGKMGGKSAGMFLAAQVVKHSPEHAELFKNVKIPKTWHISSDAILYFMHYNNLEDIYDRKYLDIERIREEYSHVVQVFKNSKFPPEVVKGLAAALDEFEDRPVIVRSSSLLEDRMGSAFAGKYKSLFLANQGSKAERLEALLDAVAEVYASIFGPDPIEYRAERGLLDVHEEMGIMIQEVVGKRVGKWEDGLVRMVPGLGTRAVDRVSDDYPVLLAPGQPGLRVNVTADEVIRYSPKKMDVIDLETNTMETVEVEELFRKYGDQYPAARNLVSLVDQDRVRKPVGLEPDWENDHFVTTFQGLIGETSFVLQVKTLLSVLCEKLNTPVDFEFAHDGEDFYLLQCRAQSYSERHAPSPIPRDLPRDRVVFSANRYISNGRIPSITHIVYVDPDRYSEIDDLQELKKVGRVIGRLNAVLPKRQFILLGPGRWGSRGDIKLGVDVTYSDINNTAVLLEIARQKGGYLPELSFGTHFFQDLVEADIRYIPLYPDDTDVVFNEVFLRRSKNILPDILAEFADLADVVRVIDVSTETDGQVLHVLLNADIGEAVGILGMPTTDEEDARWEEYQVEATPEDHWRWRVRMAERIAAHLDGSRYGVKALYVFGSAKNATAGPSSDLDLIVHFDGNEEQRQGLTLWLDGWSRALSEVNYLRTGYEMERMLDVHFVTDTDIANRTSYAVKINAVTDAARELQLGQSDASE
jgi:predicted nucleotidyltransferase